MKNSCNCFELLQVCRALPMRRAPRRHRLLGGRQRQRRRRRLQRRLGSRQAGCGRCGAMAAAAREAAYAAAHEEECDAAHEEDELVGWVGFFCTVSTDKIDLSYLICQQRFRDR